MMTIATIISARLASKRLPGKAFLNIDGVPMIRFLIERLKGTKLGGPVILATTNRREDDYLVTAAAESGIPAFRGADNDVASRYLDLAKQYELDWMVRVTGDCPFVDAETLDYCLAQWAGEGHAEMYSTKGNFPVGIDFELFNTELLIKHWPEMDAREREHLTLRFYRAEFGLHIGKFRPPKSWPLTRDVFTVDTFDDYLRALDVVRRLEGCSLSADNILRSLREH